MANVASNFDKFSQNFESVRDLKAEMASLGASIKEVKGMTRGMQDQVAKKTLMIYFLQRRKNVMKRVREHLKLLKILKESIPVIRNLIESGNDFGTAMKLMDNAFLLINQRLSALGVTQQL